MAIIIEMPKLSDTMTTGTLAKWLKKVGDKISNGDKIAEVETDKATMEMESFEDGVILVQYVAAGGVIPVGAPLLAVGKAGETPPPAPAGASAPAPAAPATPVAAPAPVAAAPAPAPVAAPAAAPAASDDGRHKASPLAKRLAAEKGVSLSGLTATGPGGLIVKADVLAGASAPAPAAAAPTPAAKAAALAAAGLEEKTIPVSNMRKVIASRLLESKTTVPHFYLEIEVDAGPLMVLRQQINDAIGELPAAKGGIKLTVNDFILKASAEALRREPKVNASWMGATIQQHGSVHLSFGVALEDGLVTPVIRDAHAKSLRQIALEAKELIAKARAKKLTPAEMSGSTFTVTNLGMFGVTGFFGIINTPNAAILSVGATLKKPVVNEAGQIVVGQRMVIGLSGDHRVIDGAVAAQFLFELKKILETPAVILV